MSSNSPAITGSAEGPSGPLHHTPAFFNAVSHHYARREATL
ncbi:MAG TPA: hypothetical protein VF807_04390 [Ktedonobacterales bacterium]